MFLIYEVALTQWDTGVLAYGIFQDVDAATEFCQRQGEKMTLIDRTGEGAIGEEQGYWEARIQKKGRVGELELRIKRLPFGNDVPDVDKAYNVLYEYDNPNYEG